MWKLLARHYFQPFKQPYSTFMRYILSWAFVDGANEAGIECKNRCKGDMAEGMKPRLRPGESDLKFSLLIVQNYILIPVWRQNYFTGLISIYLHKGNSS